MTLEEKLRIIERTDALIRRKSTGTPKELAQKLNQSERFIYELMNFMKNMGAPIIYCIDRKSYCYEYEVEFSVGFIRKREDFSKIKGGNGENFDFFLSLHEWRSDLL